MIGNEFAWVKFYTVFADKLLTYENNRQILLEKLIKVHDDLGIKFQKLERDDSVIDIDPFTVFGMFNKGLSDDNRISIMKAFAREFELDPTLTIPTKLIGIPVLNNLKAAFFFWDRPDTDIDNLWSLFRIAFKASGCSRRRISQRILSEKEAFFHGPGGMDSFPVIPFRRK